MYVLAYWSNWFYGRKLKIIINVIFIEPMYLLLNYIKRQIYLLYKKKKKKKFYITFIALVNVIELNYSHMASS
jgi:hypothetical protein